MSFNGHSRTPTPIVSGRSNYVNLKLNLRLLPPTLTKDQFMEQLHNHTTLLKDGSIIDSYYVEGCYPTKPYEKPTYSRAYLLFKNQVLLDQFMKEIHGKSFIELETNDSLIPAIGKSLYNKMPTSGRSNNLSASKNYEDDEFYKEFLSLLETSNADSFDIATVNKKLKKRNRDKMKKDKDPKKKDVKKSKSKEETKKPAKPKTAKSTKTAEKTGDGTKTTTKKKRNRNKKTEGDSTREKVRPKQANESKDSTVKPSPKPKSQKSSKGTSQDAKAKTKSESRPKSKQSQDAKQRTNQESSANSDDKIKPKMKIKLKPKNQNPKQIAESGNNQNAL